MFHNDTAPMCLEAKEFKSQNIPFEEHLTEEPDFAQSGREKQAVV